jgi:hypothetical protein
MVWAAYIFDLYFNATFDYHVFSVLKGKTSYLLIFFRKKGPSIHSTSSIFSCIFVLPLACFSNRITRPTKVDSFGAALTFAINIPDNVKKDIGQ